MTGLKFEDLYVTITETVSYTIRLSDLIRPHVLKQELETEDYLEGTLSDAWCELPETSQYCDGVEDRDVRVYADDHAGRVLREDDLLTILEAATDYQKQDEGGVV